jgi:tetratricopeptide (TPR) repeat protein
MGALDRLIIIAIMAHDTFVSYSSRDKPIADAVCNGLEAAGIRCWIAPRDILPGQDWGKAIVDAIRDSRLLVVVVSEHSNASPQVLREVERAVHAGIPIIPFRIDEVSLSGAMEYFLSVPHWLDALTEPLEAHIERLVYTAALLLVQEESSDEAEVQRPLSSIPPPRPSPPRHRLRLAIAGAVAVVAVLVIGGLLLLARGQLDRTRAPASDGVVKFAVVDFGQVDDRGQIVPWDDGARLSESVYLRLRDELQAIPVLQGLVQVDRQSIRSLQGRQNEARTEAARQLARQLGAQLLIYGNLERRGGQDLFVPEFQVTALAGAEELVGPFQLGTPIPTPHSAAGIGTLPVLGEALRARSEVITLFSIGLTYLLVKNPAQAVAYFERARDVPGWTESTGREVIYLFLGSAYRSRGGDGDSERAYEAYQMATTINPEYSRAYLGLGNIHYDRFVRSSRTDFTELDLAQESYERARTARIQPVGAQVDVKARMSLANLFLTRAQYDQGDYFPRAQQEFQQVVAEYEAGDSELQPFAANAYLGLGVIQERWAGDFLQARRFYEKSYALAEDGSDVRRIAAAQATAVSQHAP